MLSPPLHIIQEFRVVLLVHPAVDAEDNEDIRQHEQVEPHAGDRAVDDDLAEVADVEVDGVKEEEILYRRTEAIDRIKMAER